MDRSGWSRSVETPTIKVGDVEKELEIERRLRELGLWENKRRLEDDVSTLLNARIDDQDALSKTLEDCRQRRRRRRRQRPPPRGPDGRTAVDEIRDVVSLRVVRDCYGQKLAYHVDVLMGCFNRDVRYELRGGGVVVCCGSTGAPDDSARLTKEMRLQLPPSVDTAALTIAYAAGAVKIRAPYLLELSSPLKSRSGSNGSDDNNDNGGGRTYRFASISPIYSLSLQLNSRHRGALGSSESPTTMRSDSPDANGTQGLSPGSVGSVETRSVGDEAVQLSPPPCPVVSEEEGQATQLNGFTPPDMEPGRILRPGVTGDPVTRKQSDPVTR